MVLPDPYGLLPCLSALCLLANAELNTTPPRPGQELGLGLVGVPEVGRFGHEGFLVSPKKICEESFTMVFLKDLTTNDVGLP